MVVSAMVPAKPMPNSIAGAWKPARTSPAGLCGGARRERVAVDRIEYRPQHGTAGIGDLGHRLVPVGQPFLLAGAVWQCREVALRKSFACHMDKGLDVGHAGRAPDRHEIG